MIQIHRPYVAGSPVDDFNRALQGEMQIPSVESLHVVEDLLRADSALLLDAYPLQLAIEDEHSFTVEEGHIVLDLDAFVAKRAPGMGEQQGGASNRAILVLPDRADVAIDAPAPVI